MLTKQQQHRHAAAASMLQQRVSAAGDAEMSPHDARDVVESLSAGFNLNRTLLFTRLHHDVEERFGADSMLAPPSAEVEARDALHAKSEIEVYSVVVAAEEICSMGCARPAGSRLNAAADDDQGRWELNWLIQLRLGSTSPSILQRASIYHRQQPAERRRLFSSILERVFPEATKMPLIIYRLFPASVRITAALAFGDHLRAGELRNLQARLLPAITECHDCYGRPLDNGEICETCGNPVWNFDWLSDS